MTIPKIAVLATGLTAAILVATIHPTPAQAFPSTEQNCTNCHGSGVVAGTVTATPSTTTPAAGAAYTVTITIATTSSGDTGYWIANSDAVGVTGTSTGVTGGPTSALTYTRPMTAPATAGTYYYKVWANQGPESASSANFALYNITVAAPPTTTPPPTTTTTTVPPTTTTTTVPPTTVPPTTVPPVITAPGAPTRVTAIPGNGLAVVSWTPSTTGDPATSYTVTASPGGMTVTTTGTSATVTGLTNGTSYTFTVTAANSAGTSVVSAASAAVTPSASITGVVPVGAPSTGAGGASTSGDSPLMGLGGLALLLAGAAMVTAIRRRRV
jgi:serine protease